MKMKLFLTVSILLCVHAMAGTLVQFRTVFGDMGVELYDQDKPATVQNFLRFVTNGVFANTTNRMFIHRIVPGFVVQGGEFFVDNGGFINELVGYPTVTNEFNVGHIYSNTFGTIAMAHVGGDPNSAVSSWYFNLTNNPALDAQTPDYMFVVFGHVISGTNILNIFNHFQTYTGSQTTNVLQDLSGSLGLSFITLPFTRPALSTTNLLYVDITTLQVQVTLQLQSGSVQISWNSLMASNVVEYTTNFPPVWHTLVSTNGTGSKMTVTDTQSAPGRFYRVRVLN